MKGLRILLILFLIIAMPIFPTFAETSSASAQDTDEQTITRSTELMIAAQEGFDTVKVSDQTITGKQFIGLLDHYIEKTDNEKSVEWFQLLPNLRKKPVITYSYARAMPLPPAPGAMPG